MKNVFVPVQVGYNSPIDKLTLSATPIGLAGLQFECDTKRIFTVAPSDFTTQEAASAARIIARTINQLDEYFSGTRHSFDVDLDLTGTDFQVSVWRSLMLIPFGETVTYGQQAMWISRPKAARAVGAGNGKNPVAIVLACHRVVGADGSLTGFGGGLRRKQWLLDHEQRSRISR